MPTIGVDINLRDHPIVTNNDMTIPDLNVHPIYYIGHKHMFNPVRLFGDTGDTPEINALFLEWPRQEPQFKVLRWLTSNKYPLVI